MTANSLHEINTSSDTLHMSIELSATEWKLGFADRLGRNPRVRKLSAGGFEALMEEIRRARLAFGLTEDCRIISCYEAGRDGFWIHRVLVSMGIESHIVEPASIQVDRRKRRAKTDRIDAERIVIALMRWLAGDKFACRMIRVPDAEAEDARNLNREMRAIKSERTAHTNRIKSLLVAQGLTIDSIDRNFKARLATATTGDGRPLGRQLTERLHREFDRLALATDQIRALQMQQAEMLRVAARELEAGRECPANGRKQAAIAHQLSLLGGIGPVTSWTLATEIFAWRDIQNRRQLAALAGLTPTPHASGSEEREQGISKAGRGELRSLMIEIAWGWLKYQPQSALSCWYRERFCDGTKRNKKRGIVALARKLLVALGKYVRQGLIPDGAKLSKELKYNYLPSLRPRPLART